MFTRFLSPSVPDTGEPGRGPLNPAEDVRGSSPRPPPGWRAAPEPPEARGGSKQRPRPGSRAALGPGPGLGTGRAAGPSRRPGPLQPPALGPSNRAGGRDLTPRAGRTPGNPQRPRGKSPLRRLPCALTPAKGAPGDGARRGAARRPGSWGRPEAHAAPGAVTELRGWGAAGPGASRPRSPAQSRRRPRPALPRRSPCSRGEGGLAHLGALGGQTRVVPRRGAAVVIHEEGPAGLRVDLDLPARGQGVAVAGAVAGRRLNHGRVGGSAHAGSGRGGPGGEAAGVRGRGAGSRGAGPPGAESLAGRGRS